MRDYQQGSREREPLVHELYALGLSAQEIARLTKWSEAAIAKNVKRLGVSLLMLDRPKRRQDVFAVVVKRYAGYVMALALKKPLSPLDEQASAALKEWLGEDKLLAVISGINYTMEQLLCPQYPPEREGYAKLISSIFAHEGVFVQRMLLYPAGTPEAENVPYNVMVWRALLIQIASGEEPVPADEAALCRLLVRRALAEDRCQIRPIWDNQVFELIDCLLKETLTEREQQGLRLLFGLDGQPQSKRQVAIALDVTPSRVNQLEKTALRKLRQAGHSQRRQLWVIAQPVGDALQREFKRREETAALARQQAETPINPALLWSVDELNLSVRAANCLQNRDIKLIGELVQLSEAELMKAKNFGRRSLKEVEEALAGCGLHLGMRIDTSLTPQLRRQTLD